MNLRIIRIVLIVLLFVIVWALLRPANNDTIGGRILLWHSWGENDTLILESVLDKFTDIYPDAHIIVVRIPPDELLGRYIDAAELGLGPDLLIGSDEWMSALIEPGLIRDIGTEFRDTALFFSESIETLKVDSLLFGIPLTLRPFALYYNADLVSDVPETLDELLTQAEDGSGVALNSGFEQSLWGLGAFGASLFDDEGRIVFDADGYAEWLAWLQQAQDIPGIVLSRDQETLRNLFTSRRVAYYVAGAEEINLLKAELGEDQLRAVPLPRGSGGPARPFLYLDALYFNKSSSDSQLRLAMELARFLTNTEQSTTLMRETGRVPANRRVRVDPRAYPIVSGFAAQARTAIHMPSTDRMSLILRLGEEKQIQVLEGILDPATAASQIVTDIDVAIEFEE